MCNVKKTRAKPPKKTLSSDTKYLIFTGELNPFSFILISYS